jgi:hypothetical protein
MYTAMLVLGGLLFFNAVFFMFKKETIQENSTEQI